MTAAKPKVLMIAYACNPEGTGEHWLGWGWAQQAAARYHVHLITNDKHRAEIDRHAPRYGIEPFYVSVPAWYRDLTQRWGQFGSWLRGMRWQPLALRLGRELHRQHNFALVHQTTFHTFRVPFRLSELDIPSVWGPMAGGEYVPRRFYRYVGAAWLSEKFRGLANRPWLMSPPVTAALRRTRLLFVSNHCTLNFLPAWCHAKCRVVPPNALSEDQARKAEARSSRPEGTHAFELLFVGNCAPTRAMALVFEALRRSRLTKYRLRIVGAGKALELWKREAARLGVAGNVEFIGHVPQSALDPFYAGADVFVFPALRDSGGSGLLEAMSRGLPVVCLDWGGPSEMVDESCGVKVSVQTPARTIEELAAALEKLAGDPRLRATMSAAAQRRAVSVFGWDAKRRLLEATYESLIGKA